ncbi:MAG: serine/threonine protein kinase [Deltaproteobacteria bacterium]|nr:serine/threonine protein kinase [Deltaproteobacteria bacterium]
MNFRTLGRYRILGEIGEGSMGMVYAARDEHTGQKAALKVLKAEFASQLAFRRRLKREASVLASIEHPGIVRIFDSGEDEHGRVFIAMELLDGKTLAQELERRGAFPVAEAAPILFQVLDALSVLHARGIVHGDLKPSNIFLTNHNKIKVVDFGLAKADGLDRLTRTGEVTGTPIYMAPELLTGRIGREPDPRIDVYAFGVVAYQMLSGTLPFGDRKHPGQWMMDVVEGKCIPLSTRVPSLPIAWVQAVERAMHPRPQSRPSDASALLREWAPLLSPWTEEKAKT